jgi:hypothetical protein
MDVPLTTAEIGFQPFIQIDLKDLSNEGTTVYHRVGWKPMSAADSFFDTNVLLYLRSAEAAKADRAEALLAVGGIVSVQVLNEFASVASRKLAMPIPEIRDILSTIQAVCIVKPLDVETHAV